MDASNVSVVMDFPVSVIVKTQAFSSSWWPCALLADLLWRALWVGWILGEVVLARVLWDTVLVSELVDLHWPTS